VERGARRAPRGPRVSLNAYGMYQFSAEGDSMVDGFSFIEKSVFK